jgi:zinc D-Ala-D-Ala carboxypeptidase
MSNLSRFIQSMFKLIRQNIPQFDTSKPVDKSESPDTHPTPQSENSGWRWPHFLPKELSCRHCGALPDPLDVELLDRLEALRSIIGKPLRVNSGHRCRQHNLIVGGAAYSQHKKLAVDVSLHGLDPLKLYTAAVALGFLGIGLGDSFIHLDMRRKIDGHQPPRKLTVWYYSPSGKKKWQQLLKKENTDGLS